MERGGACSPNGEGDGRCVCAERCLQRLGGAALPVLPPQRVPSSDPFARKRDWKETRRSSLGREGAVIFFSSAQEVQHCILSMKSPSQFCISLSYLHLLCDSRVPPLLQMRLLELTTPALLRLAGARTCPQSELSSSAEKIPRMRQFLPSPHISDLSTKGFSDVSTSTDSF